MSNVIRRGFYSPRWIPRNEVVVRPQRESRVLPSIFANETIYPMRLVSLSFTSDFRVADVVQGQNYLEHPRWANRVMIELGKSGCSDQNLVAGSISAICATPVIRRNKMLFTLNQHFSYDLRLPRPYRLARDAGLEVVAGNRYADESLERSTIVVKAHTDSGKPRILAADTGTLPVVDKPQVILDSADLFNDGEEAINIDRIVMTDRFFYIPGETTYINPTQTHTGWIINPTVGTAWMPTDVVIPVGNIAPSCSAIDRTDVGPRVYLFPPNTYLDPEQHLALRMWNMTQEADNDEDVINVCLYGELEVR